MLFKIICCSILAIPLCLVRTEAQDAVAEGKTSIVLLDGNGKPFENHSSDIAGTPFLVDDWRLGLVTLQHNRRFDSVRLRLNLVTQQVHFIDKDNQEIPLFKGYIKMVRFYDAVPGMHNPAEFL